ncbi:MAG: hypothetical protein Q4D38_04425 [Planctomycetia bacterium]|nr:hypothetical protein [Planctomycetia bacterium]
MTTYVSVAYEDQLTFAVVQKLFSLRKDLSIGENIHCNGQGKIKKRILSYNLMAKNGKPAFVVTDLDQKECPATLISEWLGDVPVSENLLFRVAVREVESWVLADISSITRFLGVGKKLIPENTDTLPDPKAFLIQLAKKSKKRDIKGIIPRNESASIGLDYNHQLCRFVQEHWRIENAILHSPSLKRSVERLKNWNL